MDDLTCFRLWPFSCYTTAPDCKTASTWRNLSRSLVAMGSWRPPEPIRIQIKKEIIRAAARRSAATPLKKPSNRRRFRLLLRSRRNIAKGWLVTAKPSPLRIAFHPTTFTIKAFPPSANLACTGLCVFRNALIGDYDDVEVANGFRRLSKYQRENVKGKVEFVNFSVNDNEGEDNLGQKEGTNMKG